MKRFEERIARPGNNMATIEAAFREFGKELNLKFRNNDLKIREMLLMIFRYEMSRRTKRTRPPSPHSAGPSAGA